MSSFFTQYLWFSSSALSSLEICVESDMLINGNEGYKMGGLLSGFRKSKGDDYNVWKLVDHRELEESSFLERTTHFICDIDKTYLETNFESVYQLARIALEDADEKVTVTGAAEVLLASRWGSVSMKKEDSFSLEEPNGLHFVSSSPSQMRSVLEEKMLIDGIDWSSDTFKDQAYNLKKGKFGLLKHQTSYKTAAILALVAKMKKPSDLYFLGDNAEADSQIYLGLKLFLEKKLSHEGYKKYLDLFEVGSKVVDKIFEQVSDLPAHKVKMILIRNLDEGFFVSHSPLTDSIRQFENYFEVFLLLVKEGVISPLSILDMSRKFHNQHGMSVGNLYKVMMDFSSKLSLTEEVKKNLEHCIFEIKKINGFVVPEDNSEAFAFYRCDMDSLDKLTEDEILSLAKNWANELGTEKSHKKL